METKRLSFNVKDPRGAARLEPSADPRPSSGVSADTPGSNVFPVARVAPQSEVVKKPAPRASTPSTLPPPPPGLFLRPSELPRPRVAPMFRPSGVITQLEVAPALPLPAPPPLPRELRLSAAPQARSSLFEQEPGPSTVDYADVSDVERTAAIVLRDGVRRAEARDAEVLAAIQAMAREHAFERSLLPRPTELDFDQLVRAWRFRASPASRARTFLALRSGEPAGFVSAGPGRAGFTWEGEIYAAHVHPRFWGTRVAENLAAAAFDHLVQRGFSVVRIWVTVSNIEVLTRLTPLGFRPVAQRYHPQHGGLEEAFVRRLD